MGDEQATDSGEDPPAEATDAAVDEEGTEQAEQASERPGEGGEPELASAVRDHDDELADEVAALARERADLAAEVEALEERVKRVQADFQNYKKRTERERERVEARATEDLVERLLDVRDNLARALDQDADSDIREGVAATLRSFDEVLAEEGVAFIEPEPGADVDPVRHEVMLQVDSDQPADTVAELYRPGYELAGSVVRPAQVTVSSGDGGAGAGGGDGGNRDGDGEGNEGGDGGDDAGGAG